MCCLWWFQYLWETSPSYRIIVFSYGHTWVCVASLSFIYQIRIRFSSCIFLLLLVSSFLLVSLLFSLVSILIINKSYFFVCFLIIFALVGFFGVSAFVYWPVSSMYSSQFSKWVCSSLSFHSFDYLSDPMLLQSVGKLLWFAGSKLGVWSVKLLQDI